MASQRDQQQVQYVPQPLVQLDNTVLAQQQQNNAAASNMLANFGTQVGELADAEASRRAEEDAAQIIKRDGNQMIIPPASFDPSGFSTRAYRDTYARTAKAAYTHAAAQEFSEHAANVRAAYPVDYIAVQAKLTEKRDAMLNGLDPAVLPFMTARFNGIMGQATSQTMMAKKTQEVQVLDRRAQDALASFQHESARFGSGWTKDMPIEDIAANKALFGERWKEFAALAEGAGWGPEKVGLAYKDTRIKIMIAEQEAGLRSLVIPLMNGDVPAAEIAQIAENIDAFAKKLGPDADAARTRLNGVLGEIQQRAGLRARAEEQAGRNETLNQVQGLIRQNIPQTPFDSPMPADAMQRQIQTAMTATMLQPGLSDSVRMNRVAMLGQVNTGNQKIAQDFISSRVIGLAGQMENPELSVGQRASARTQLQTVLSDPDIMDTMPAGIRHHGQTLVNKTYVNPMGENVAQLLSEGHQGKLAPPALGNLRKQLVASGAVGSGPGALMSEAKFDTFAQAAAAAFDKREHAVSTFKGAQQDWSSGKIMDKAKADAVKGLAPFSLPGGAGKIDAKNPEHLAALSSYVSRYGVVPDVAAEGFKTVMLGGDPEAMLDALAVHNSIKSVIQPRSTPEFLLDDMGKLIGADPAARMAELQAVGPEAIMKAKGASPISRTAGVDGTVPKTRDERIDKGITEEVMNSMRDAHRGSGLFTRLFGGAGGLSKEQQAMSAALKDLGYTPPAIHVPLFTSAPGALSLKPDVKEAVAERMVSLLANNRDIYDALARQTGGTAERYAARIAITELAGKVMLKDDFWGGGKTLAYKDGARVIGETLGLPDISQSDASAFLEQVVNADSKARNLWREFDPGSLQMTLRKDAYGEHYWNIGGSQGSNHIATLGTLAFDDPRLGAYAKDITQLVKKEFLKNIHGQSSPGSREATPREIATIAGSLSTKIYPAGGVSGMLNDLGALVVDKDARIRQEIVKEIRDRAHPPATKVGFWDTAQTRFEKTGNADPGRAPLSGNARTDFNGNREAQSVANAQGKIGKGIPAPGDVPAPSASDFGPVFQWPEDFPVQPREFDKAGRRFDQRPEEVRRKGAK